jgi:hypothetical protein
MVDFEYVCSKVVISDNNKWIEPNFGTGVGIKSKVKKKL